MSDYEIARSAYIDAAPARVHALIADFREWVAWSPWEGLDPNLERTYGGAESGIGSTYHWRGNRKAGEGSMEITADAPQRIDIALTFLKPWKATNHLTFELVAEEEGTKVTWRMAGTNSGMAGIFSRIFSMDKAIGGDFEKGLAALARVALGPGTSS